MTEVHILKGSYEEWRNRIKSDEGDPMLCGVTLNYHKMGHNSYWETAAVVNGSSGKWEDNNAPTCATCALLHLADPSHTLRLPK